MCEKIVSFNIPVKSPNLSELFEVIKNNSASWLNEGYCFEEIRFKGISDSMYDKLFIKLSKEVGD